VRFGVGLLRMAFLLAGFSLGAFAQTVTLTPSTSAFGNQVVNTASVPKRLTLKNGLSIPLTISAISTNLSDYTETSTCPISPSTLRPGGSCLIYVTFTPSMIGSRQATLTVADNASGGSQTASLSGSGVVAVSVTPGSLSFASQVRAGYGHGS
jgi:hypothetical protein